MDQENANGVKLAAQRRLNFELGIPLHQVDISKFIYLTRILYSSPSGGPWGEHELDYILFLKGEFDISPNDNEVKEIQFVKKENFKKLLDDLAEKNIPITPWFNLIVQTFLSKWWDNIDDLERFRDHNKIHNMIKT